MKAILQSDKKWRNGTDRARGEGVVEVVRRQLDVGRRLDLELLQDSGAEDEKFFVGQRLAEADTFTDSERSDFVVGDKLAVLVEKAIGVEGVGVLKLVRVVHDVIEAAEDDGVLRYDVSSHFDCLRRVMWNSSTDQAGRSQAFQKDSVQVVQLRAIIQVWEPLSTHNLKSWKTIVKCSIFQIQRASF